MFFKNLNYCVFTLIKVNCNNDFISVSIVGLIPHGKLARSLKDFFCTVPWFSSSIATILLGTTESSNSICLLKSGQVALENVEFIVATFGVVLHAKSMIFVELKLDGEAFWCFDLE